MKILLKALLFSLPIFLSIGCSQVKQPTATFKSMNVGDVTPHGFTMNFGVDLNNPNPVALPLSNADYKLNLAGVNVLEGTAKPEGTLPPNGSLPMTLPVTVTFDQLLAAGKAISGSGGKVGYTLTGDLSLGEGADALLGKSAKVPLKYQGDLDLTKFLSDPELLLHNPAVRKLATQAMGGMFSH